MATVRRSPANLAELEAKLRSLPIREDAYDLTGYGQDEPLVIRNIRRGWAVFYAERGLESGWREFPNEAKACDYFLRTVRGWRTD